MARARHTEMSAERAPSASWLIVLMKMMMMMSLQCHATAATDFSAALFRLNLCAMPLQRRKLFGLIFLAVVAAPCIGGDCQHWVVGGAFMWHIVPSASRIA